MEDEDSSPLQAVSLSPTQRVMANVTTAKAVRRAVSNDIQAVGIVSYDESRYSLISMRYPGRIEKLYLTFTGQSVHKGDSVALVYSTEAVAAQQKYVLAYESYLQSSRGDAEYTGPASKILLQAKEKLIQWGFTEIQLASLRETYNVPTFVTVYSPVNGIVVKKSVDPQRYVDAGAPLFDVVDLSKVWVFLDVYEKDIRFVRAGQPVRMQTEAYPLELFNGRVSFVDPVVTPETRTIRVRTEFSNPQRKLKPNMYVNATISVPSREVLVVPATAILSTGKRAHVWVEVKENTFVPRTVVVGQTSEGFAVVLAGLDDGDTIAATGAFLIDSEGALTWTPSGDQESQ
jgi:Cu(I)/Ag(I) efflux system membrane fusion protein